MLDLLFVLGLSALAGAPRPDGGVVPREDEAWVLEQIFLHKEELVDCAKDGWRLAPQEKGRVTIQWEVDVLGRVRNVSALEAAQRETVFARCALEVISKFEYQPRRPTRAPYRLPLFFGPPRPRSKHEKITEVCRLPAMRPDAGAEPGPITQGEITEVLLARTAALGACAKRGERKEPDVRGTVVVRWDVNLNGRAINIEATTPEFKDTYVAKCLVQEIAKLKFPSGRATDDLSIPFKFGKELSWDPESETSCTFD